MKSTFLDWIVTLIAAFIWWFQQRILLCTNLLHGASASLLWSKNDHRMETDEASMRLLYNFEPFKLTTVEYKPYRPFGRGGIHSYPKPRSGHRIACNETDVFVFGGFNPNTPTPTSRHRTSYLFQELWKFNILTSRWVLCYGPVNPALPEELASNAALIKDDMLLVYGGTGYPFGVNCSSKCYIFGPYRTPKTATLLDTTGEEPPQQYGQAIALNDRYLYVVGGTSSFDYSCDIHRLDLISKKWELVIECREDIRDDPTGRYRHEIAFLDNKIFVIGGGTSASAFDLVNVPFFSLDQGKWDYVKTQPDPKLPAPGYPLPRKCHTLVQYESDAGPEIVVTGGYDNDAYFNDIWKLNLRTFQWSMFTATLPNPMYFHDAATSGNGCMYVFGGIEVKGNDKYRTNQLYKMWVTIPKLTEICWETLTQRDPLIAFMERKELLDLGVPERFVKRVEWGRARMHTIDD